MHSKTTEISYALLCTLTNSNYALELIAFFHISYFHMEIVILYFLQGFQFFSGNQ